MNLISIDKDRYVLSAISGSYTEDSIPQGFIQIQENVSIETIGMKYEDGVLSKDDLYESRKINIPSYNQQV